MLPCLSLRQLPLVIREFCSADGHAQDHPLIFDMEIDGRATGPSPSFSVCQCFHAEMDTHVTDASRLLQLLNSTNFQGTSLEGMFSQKCSDRRLKDDQRRFFTLMLLRHWADEDPNTCESDLLRRREVYLWIRDCYDDWCRKTT